MSIGGLVFMILLGVILFPFLSAIVSFFLHSEKGSKAWALLSVFIEGFLVFFSAYLYSQAGYLSVEIPWIQTLGIHLHFGVRGFELWMMILSAVVPAMAVVSSSSKRANPGSYYGLLLGMQGALMGLFACANLFLFYIFWELSILPSFFLLMGWGGLRKEKTAVTYVVYSLAGSFALLAGLLYVFMSGGQVSVYGQMGVFILFFIAVAIKIPLWPFHSWQPDTYEQTDHATTMMVAGVLSKMGLLGILKVMLLFAPLGAVFSSDKVIGLAIVSILYGSSLALVQGHFKRVIAYSSLAHMGLMAASLFSGTSEGIQGSIFQMGSHALNVVGLIWIGHIIYERTGTLKLAELGGIRSRSPFLSAVFLVVILGSIGFPLTNGFVGETLMLFGLYSVHPLFAILAGLSLVLGAWYMMRLFQAVMLGKGNSNLPEFNLTWSERIGLGVIMVSIVGMGIFPQPFLDFVTPSSFKESDSSCTQ